MLDYIEDKNAEVIIKKMPSNYIANLKQLISTARNIFSSNLLNITLGGSGGKGNIIDGWSDLDIYIVLEKYNDTQIIKFYNYFTSNDIHIGITFYTLREIKNKLFDSKTKIMLYERQKFKVNPILYGEDIFSKIEYHEIIINDFQNYPNVLQVFRREFLILKTNPNQIVSNKYIKKLTVLIKCILTGEGIFVYGYDTVFNEFKKLCQQKQCNNLEKINFDIISIIKDINNCTNDIINLSEFVLWFVEEYKIYNN